MKYLAIILALLATPVIACQQPLNVCDADDNARTVVPIDRDNPLDPAPDNPAPEPEPPLDDGR